MFCKAILSSGFTTCFSRGLSLIFCNLFPNPAPKISTSPSTTFDLACPSFTGLFDRVPPPGLCVHCSWGLIRLSLQVLNNRFAAQQISVAGRGPWLGPPLNKVSWFHLPIQKSSNPIQSFSKSKLATLQAGFCKLRRALSCPSFESQTCQLTTPPN